MLKLLGILVHSMVELADLLLQIIVQQGPPVDEVLLQKRLSVQVEQIESVQADHSLQILLSDVLAAALGQELEGQNFLVDSVKSDQLGIQNEVLHPSVQ